MNNRDYNELHDALETARIYAGAEMGRLCNENKHIQAYVFQAIRDSLAQNIELLKSYNTLYGKLKEEDDNIKALEQEPCRDAISREELLKAIDTWDKFGYSARYGLERLDKDDKEYVPYIHYDDVIKCIKGISSVKQEPQTRQCKNCKWWKDSDGKYRRDIGAESKCPINRKEVFEGSGYCYMFKPQESEDKEMKGD